ncbi:MAG: Fic family protein [Cyanobacteria bacterium J06553_1]
MTVPYQQYTPSLLEPAYPKRTRQLEDLAVDLVVRASRLTQGLHPTVVTTLGELVRSMNCYYSNLIEGHRTLPTDIERALSQDLSQDPKQRDFQLEAKAHIEVQRLIDLDSDWQERSPVSLDMMQHIHQAFYERLPERFWAIESKMIVPGELRSINVKIGAHVPPYPEVVPKFLERFSQLYDPSRLSKLEQVIFSGAAHHRFLWIHPFPDGNGRVVRLMSHAYLQRSGVGNSLWSISRGLARQVNTYRQLLALADQQRRNDYDGRGNLTLKGLADFSEFFLETCIDQVDYMSQLFEPQRLLKRMEAYVMIETHERQLLPGSFAILKAAFLEGKLNRGDAAALTGYKERQARSVLKRLLEAGLLSSTSPKGPVKLSFPVVAAQQWFPRLWSEG